MNQRPNSFQDPDRPACSAIPQISASASDLNRSTVEIATLCVGNALSTCGGIVLPVWVAGFVHEGLMSISRVGWLASAYLALLATSGIATSIRGGSVNQRRVGVTLAGVIAVATVLAAFHTYAIVLAGLGLFAVASGVLHSLMIRAGALGRNATRVLALMTAAAYGFASLAIFCSRYATKYAGVSGLFLMITVFSVAAGSFMFLGFPDTRFMVPTSVGRTPPNTASSLRLARVLACTAVLVVNTAVTSVGVYGLIIASNLGFAFAAATTAVAIAEPFPLLGALAAHQLGERLGMMRPILFGIAVLCGAQFLLVNASSIQVYSLALIILSVTFSFYLPYTLALVARLEPSGRLVGALTGLMTIGTSIGPALGGTVMTAWSFHALPPVAASLFAIATIFFLSVGHLMVNEGTR